MHFTMPGPLARGDLVAVVAPSTAIDRKRFDPGLAWLRERYRVQMQPSIHQESGYLAGSDTRRRDELASAMLAPDVKAIFVARAGYGSTRILAELPWDAFAAHPKWIVGFSDITALLLEAASRKIASLHGPVVTTLSSMSDAARDEFEHLLAGRRHPAWFPNLEMVISGSAQGILVGGNLTMLVMTAAAGKLRLPRGCILAIEDTTERPYRIDRMLTALRLGGHFARTSGVLLGDWVNCQPDGDGVTAMDAIMGCLGDLGIPIYAGAPFGHGSVNVPFVVGAQVKLADGQVVSM